jgi:SRSO17 transposase
MKTPLVIRGRNITDTDIGLIRSLIDRYGNQSRDFISKKLAERWKWFQPNGRLKDRACRDILSSLDKKRFISLPPLRARVNRFQYGPKLSDSPVKIDTSLIQGNLSSFKPFSLKMVSQGYLEPLWNYLMRRYHYLGYKVLVGSHLKYLAFFNDRVVAALGWSSAVFKLADRDKAIGWSNRQKKKHLHRVANNTRFIVFPWVSISCLASHILSQNIRILNRDWLNMYNYQLWLLETFVDTNRFKGTSYKAANWIHVGQTKGYQKQGNSFQYHGQTKEVFLYPLHHDFRKKIGCDTELLPPLNHTYFFTVQQQRGEEKMILRHSGWNPNVLPPLDLNEKDIDIIADEFEQFHKLFEDAFYRIEQTGLSQCYIQGLMSPLKRKSMEPIAINLMDIHRVRSLQHFVSSGRWDLDLLAQRQKEETAKTVADPLGIFNVDGSDFPKKGKESVGVSRQYCGRLGKIENCQAGVFLGYSSPKGYTLLDRRLFLPKVWFSKDYQERWRKCKIPDDIVFKTKPQLATKMIKDARASGLFPTSWVTCDTIFGNSPEFLDNLPDDLFYMAEVASNTHVWTSRPQTYIPPYCGKGRRPCKVKLKKDEPKSVHVSEIAKDPLLVWKTVILDEGTKGPIVAKIARLRVIESRDALPGEERWLFIRYCPESKEIKYFLSNAPENIPFEEMSRVCILRWPIEQCFKEGKSEIGMDQYEHRSWPAWHRHMTFVFLAQLFLLRVRHNLKKSPSVNTATGMFTHESCAPNETFCQRTSDTYNQILSKA